MQSLIRSIKIAGWALACLVILAGCQSGTPANTLRVRVVVDGKERVFSQTEVTSVSQFLQKQGISLGEFDRVNPDDFSLISDNMLITIIRVKQQEECQEEEIPYETDTIDNLDVPPGTTKLAEAGVNGTARQCFQVLYEDGVEKRRDRSSRTILKAPVKEIIYRGVDSSKIEPVPVQGMLAYISNGQGRIIENNSRSNRAIPTGCVLDGYVFAVSQAHQLLFTCTPGASSDIPGAATPAPTVTPSITFNELWVLLDVTDPAAKPVQLSAIKNVLTADWVPNQPLTFSYSTLDPRPGQIPNYQAFNDLFTVRLDGKSGRIIKVTQIVKSKPSGVYSRWGTQFKWSPDGKQIAWAQPDGIGIVDQKSGELKKTLFDFRVYSTTLSRNWVWTPSLSWSPGGELLLCSVHGKPLGGETPETSPVFDVSVAQYSGLYAVPMISQAGIWASPQFSPLIDNGSGNPVGYLAYLQARDKIDSISSEYDLVVADRDGSNPQTIFPGKDKVGLKPIDSRFGNLYDNGLVWSPDAHQIAVIYQGDIYIIDLESGHASAITRIGNIVASTAHHPRWVS